MTEKKTFVMYKDWKAAFSKMTDEQAGKMIKAVFQYQSGDEEISFDDPGLPFFFEIIKDKFDEDSAKYQETCDRNRENGSKGGRPKTEKTEQNRKNPVGLSKTEKTQSGRKNPDSDNDSDNENDPEVVNDKGIKDKGVQGEKGTKNTPAATADTPLPVPFVNYEEIVEDYNNTCKSLSRVTTLSDARRKAIRARINTRGVDEIHRAFVLAEESDFLKGANNRNWAANFDWIMNDTNMAKILDGNYTNRPRDSGAKPPGQEDGFEWLSRQLKEGGML